MHKVLTVLGLAVAVPVALAAPALAKPPAPGGASVSAVLIQHEGFRAEVTYRCADPKDEEGTIRVDLLQPAGPGPSALIIVGTGFEEAKCDGKVRDDKVKILIPAGATVRADLTVQLDTTLFVDGVQVASDIGAPEPVIVAPTGPSPSPSSESASPSASPSPSGHESESESPSPSSSVSPSESESPETATPSPSPSATS